MPCELTPPTDELDEPLVALADQLQAGLRDRGGARPPLPLVLRIVHAAAGLHRPSTDLDLVELDTRASLRLRGYSPAVGGDADRNGVGR